MNKQSVPVAFLKVVGYTLLFNLCHKATAYLVQTIILITLTAGMGITGEAAYARLNTAYYGMVYETSLIASLIFIGFLFLMHRGEFPKKNAIHKASPSALFAGFFSGFGSFLVAGIFVGIVTNLVPAVANSQAEYSVQNQLLSAYAPRFWPEVVYACVMAPLAEELLCRGAILSTLKKSMPAKHAIFFSALTFALVHGNLYQIVFTLPLGLLMGYFTHRMGSIWPAFFLHAAFNSTNYLLRFGTYLGYPTESEMWLFFNYAAQLLCIFAIPMALLLLRVALERIPAPEEGDFVLESRHTPAYYKSVPSYGDSLIQDEKGETMAAPEYIIVGLGNPGEKYASNRHNMGFIALDYIAIRQNASIQNLRFRALTGETMMGGKKVLLMKPQTFMNSSGEAVREAAAFYKIPPERILVIFDDISFAPGVFRIRASGSAGGHNGIKSIIACLSSDAFPRVKMGVGTPPAGWELMNWVLGNPSKEDMDHVIASLEDVYRTTEMFVAGDLEKASAAFNGKTH